MKQNFLFLLALSLLSVPAPGQKAQNLFNGKDLTGWDGDPRLWSVVDGVLVGESNDTDKKVAPNTFLIWTGGEVGDFEFKMTARVTGKNNSGVQYRSKVLDKAKWSVGGYQMDMHPKQEYLGMLYEERGRGISCLRGQKVVLEKGAKPKVTGKLPVPEVDLAQFNEYRIVARGNTVKHFVNGKQATEIVDNDPEKRSLKGALAIQLHQGPAMKLEVKSITLRPLKKSTTATATATSAVPAGQQARDETANYSVAKDFKLEKLYDVPKETEGSWVAMTVRDDGRLICSDQYGKLYNVTVSPAGVTSAQHIDLGIGGAHGLLWFQGALWVSVNEKAGGDSGVYRVTDENADGKLDTIKMIMAVRGSGEHGTHALVASPDGKWIYFIAGNHTSLPEKIDRHVVPQAWKEDHLIERQPDARGHANGRMAPGGYICRFQPDGKNWELVSNGYRNAYDMAFNERGDLFAYDADMEWDFGTPWYRPTRLCHAVSGSEFGWRHGTGKWPAYYEDSLPAVVDLGPGSPTGVLSGLGAKFPARYQRAIFLLDWTFATIYAVHLEDAGASYSGKKEEFVAGKGLAFTDAVIGKDGALYFTTGGRRTTSALWRVTYTGSESTAPVAAAAAVAPDSPAGIRMRLETMHAPKNGADMDLIVNSLGSDDRFVRFAARIALEHQPVDEWRSLLAEQNDPWRAIMISIAMARQGAAGDRPAMVSALGSLDWGGLSKAQKLALLRAYALLFSRFGEPSEVVRAAVLKHLDPHYPSKDDTINRELCRVLSYLKSPTVVEKTLALMASLEEPPLPDWAVLASRNDRYGGAIRKMLENLPSAQKMHYAYCLRTVPGPWTPGQRKQFFTWFSDASKKSGGASYGGFINNIRKDALKHATAEERTALEAMKFEAAPNPYENLPPVQGPGKNWTKEEVVAMIEGGLDGADRENGKKMYSATLCAACHRFEGEGGAAGPDLSGISARFQAGDIVDAIIDPSKEVSDQYRFEVITKTDGSALTGRTIERKDGVRVVATSPFDFSETTEIPSAEIRTVEESPFSPMPPGLIYRLNEKELRDLLGYLLKN